MTPDEIITNAINQMRDDVVTAINEIDVDKFYLIFLRAGQISIADKSTIYWDNKARNAETDTNNAGLVIPKSGIIRVATLMAYTISTVFGSGETIPVFIRINHTTDHLVASRSIVSPNRLTYWDNFAMNIPVVAGDILQIKTAFPDFVTVPGSTSWSGNLLIEY